MIKSQRSSDFGFGLWMEINKNENIGNACAVHETYNHRKGHFDREKTSRLLTQ